MKRLIITELIKWKNRSDRKPTAEVDFVAQFGGKIVPVDVKASINVKSRSLGVYCDKYKPVISIRTSLLNLKKDG